MRSPDELLATTPGLFTVKLLTWNYYVNGVPTLSGTAPQPIADHGRPILIGADYSPHLAVFWKGTIDEVKIFNCALSPDQVVSDMNTNWPF